MRASIFGAQHDLAVSDGNLHVHERQRPMLLRHELLAPHLKQQVEHLLIQHLPRSNLLLDHVEAGLLHVHLRSATT